MLRSKKKKITSLYFGGGTAALLLSGLREIISKLDEYFKIEEGIGIELHPDDINDSTLNALKAIGVNMLSIGIQSFDSACLRSLGWQDSNFKEKLKLVKSYSFSVIDVDLIFGIPKQTKTSLINDIELAFEYGATQVSTYPFIDFTFSYNKNKPIKESAKQSMLAWIVKYTNIKNIERTSV